MPSIIDGETQWPPETGKNSLTRSSGSLYPGTQTKWWKLVVQNPPPHLHYKICRLTLFKQLCREVSAGCISEQCAQEVDAHLNQQQGCIPICLGLGTPLLPARWGCCKAISKDWQSQKGAKAFAKAKQNASPFFSPTNYSSHAQICPHVLTWTLFLSGHACDSK